MKELTALDGLASRINEEHRLCEESARATVVHAMNAGELLLEAKAAKPHGGWTAWLEENFRSEKRTAQRYMLIARNKDMLEAEETTCVSFLSTSAALRLIQEKQRGEKQRDPFTPPAVFAPPADNGRVLKIYRNEELRGWEIAYGPNEVGLHLKEYLAKVEQRPEHQETRDVIAECEDEAERLREEGQRLLSEADEWAKASLEIQRGLSRKMRAVVKQEHGDVCPQIDQYEFFVLDEKLDKHLKTLSSKELADFLMNSGNDERLKRGVRGMYGDMADMDYGEMRPLSEDGWHGMGGFDGFHSDKYGPGKMEATGLMPPVEETTTA